jgi:hypothetical protein
MAGKTKDGTTTWMPRTEAAEAVQVGYQTLRSWERAGHVRSRKREGRVQVALEDARRYAVTSAVSPLSKDDLKKGESAARATPTKAKSKPKTRKKAKSKKQAGPAEGSSLPMRREELQRILDKALGADEWAHRAGIAETKAEHQTDRLRELRDELARAMNERDEARAETERLRRELDRVRAGLSPRQLRKVGIEQ